MAVDVGQAITVKQANLRHLIRRQNVVGVGVGYKVTASGPTDEVAVVVNVARKLPKAQLAESDLIPPKINEVRTDVVETGVIRAFQGHRGRWRPTIPAGVSIGHIHVTAGTLGCLVRRGDEIFLLSNNHVLADVNAGQKGDPILQPGSYDGGTADDRVAVLDDYIPLDFGGEAPRCSIAGAVADTLNFLAELSGSTHRLQTYRQTPGINEVDAALARPLNPEAFTPDILEIGRPAGAREIGLGGAVKKSGRTTGYTEGRIIQIDVTTSVVYNGRTATFSGQLMADGMSAPGDSGSAVLDRDNYIVGLLYAGSSNTTLINPIQKVLQALNVEVVT
ncbi:MAG: hypothetical protein D6796_01970 [Caldilineae bacterium]|nr:MAG: hypothetical protein D6796_01970 [Caldilineae bacterium]